MSLIPKPFQDRRHAGRLLAAAIAPGRQTSGTVVLGLPRGGVPVAYEVARALPAPLDVFVVRKLGVPSQPELAMGAIGPGGVKVLNRTVVEKLAVSDSLISEVAQRELKELARREADYRGGLSPIKIEGQEVILVDDGLATGSSMLAAVQAVRQQKPSRVTIGVPVAASQTASRLAHLCDELISLLEPDAFYAVGQWYEDFSQITDEEVRKLLRSARRELSSKMAG